MPEVVQLSKEIERIKKELGEMRETFEVLFDRELMESLKRGIKDIKEGRVISLEEYEKKYGKV